LLYANTDFAYVQFDVYLFFSDPKFVIADTEIIYTMCSYAYDPSLYKI